MVDDEEDVVSRSESSGPAEEGTGEGSQPGQAVRLRESVDAGCPVGTGRDASEADAGRGAQRPSPAQQPSRRFDPAVSLPHSSGPGKGRQRQVQVSQTEEKEEEKAKVQTRREARPTVSSGEGQRRC